jgi:hypothetical protein
MRVAFSSIAQNTGSSSPGDELMTRSTSEVAVCWSNDSDSSRVRCCSASNSRTFSMAITAWSAKLDKGNLLIGKRLHDRALEKQNSNGHAFALQRHAK